MWAFHNVIVGEFNFHRQAVEICLQIMEKSSKELVLTHSLLPEQFKLDAAVLYAWYRRIHDIVDQLPANEKQGAIKRFKEEIEAIYQNQSSAIIAENKVLIAFRELVRRRRIPRYYTHEFLEGIKMDIMGTSYPNIYLLYKYCFRVSSTIGLMFCHIVGTKDPKALNNIAHLGIALQLSRICESVRKNWKSDRLYLPVDMLKEKNPNLTLSHELNADSAFTLPSDTFINSHTSLTDPMTWGNELTKTELNVPTLLLQTSESVIPTLQELAELHYQQGFIGLKYLPWRASLSMNVGSKILRSVGRKVMKNQLLFDRPNSEIKSQFMWGTVIKTYIFGGLDYLLSSRLNRLHRYPVQIPMYMLLFEHFMRDIQSKDADETNRAIKEVWTRYFSEKDEA